MSAVRQWLVQPQAVDAAYYVTNKPAVAQKRADAGDFVMEIKRRDTPDTAPGFVKVHKSAVSDQHHAGDEL